MHKITVGDWHQAEGGPIQIVSGPIGRKSVHFEAPDAGYHKKWRVSTNGKNPLSRVTSI